MTIPETPKPLVSLLASNLALVFASSTLNPFRQASSSAPHGDDHKHQFAESASASSSSLSSSSSSAISYGEEDNSSPSSLFRHSQIKSISPTRDSFSSNELSPSPPTKPSHDPNARNTNAQNLYSPEAERWEHVMQTIDKQELGKHILGLAIPMAMGLVFSNNPLAMIKNMKGVAISLCFAFAAIWNGLLLRKTYGKASTLILILGIALMMLAFFAFVGCFLPLHLQWIPALCWLASLFPLVKFVIAFLRTMKVPRSGENRDLEKGVY